MLRVGFRFLGCGGASARRRRAAGSGAQGLAVGRRRSGVGEVPVRGNGELEAGERGGLVLTSLLVSRTSTRFCDTPVCGDLAGVSMMLGVSVGASHAPFPHMWSRV